MRNSNGIRTILTGIFVLAGIAILVIGIFIIGGKDKTFKDSLTAKAVFADVNGLAKGSNVWYSGVKVGTVKKVGFVQNGVEVTFSIEEDVQQKIRNDANDFPFAFEYSIGNNTHQTHIAATINKRMRLLGHQMSEFLASSAKAALIPSDDPQKTQMFIVSGEKLELVVVLVLAHHLVWDDPGRDNSENK